MSRHKPPHKLVPKNATPSHYQSHYEQTCQAIGDREYQVKMLQAELTGLYQLAHSIQNAAAAAQAASSGIVPAAAPPAAPEIVPPAAPETAPKEGTTEGPKAA
jgi:hypothetical protein